MKFKVKVNKNGGYKIKYKGNGDLPDGPIVISKQGGFSGGQIPSKVLDFKNLNGYGLGSIGRYEKIQGLKDKKNESKG